MSGLDRIKNFQQLKRESSVPRAHNDPVVFWGSTPDAKERNGNTAPIMIISAIVENIINVSVRQRCQRRDGDINFKISCHWTIIEQFVAKQVS